MNLVETHWQNPQFRLALREPDVDEGSQARLEVCSFLVELLQNTGRELLPHAPPSLDHIGFTVYKVRTPDATDRNTARSAYY